MTTLYYSAEKSGRSSFLEKIGNFFSSVGAHMVAARQATADHYVDSYLRALDDKRLAELNFSAEEIKKIRQGKTLAQIRFEKK